MRGSTVFWDDVTIDPNYSKGKVCPICEIAITNRATYCKHHAAVLRETVQPQIDALLALKARLERVETIGVQIANQAMAGALRECRK